MEDSDWIKNYVSNDTEHHCNYNFTDERKKIHQLKPISIQQTICFGPNRWIRFQKLEFPIGLTSSEFRQIERPEYNYTRYKDGKLVYAANFSYESKIHHTLSYENTILPTPCQRLMEFVKVSNSEISQCRIDWKCFRSNYRQCRLRDYDEHNEEFRNENQYFMFFGPIKAKIIINDGNEYDGPYFCVEYHLQLEHNTYVETSKGLEYLILECLPREDSIEVPISIQFEKSYNELYD